MPESPPPPAAECRLKHPVFTQLGEPLFRRSEADSAPVMVVELGDREASLPLRAIQREFAIEDASDDGRMLGLIAASLDFVTSLRLGDALPAEVLTGDASWEPTAEHVRLAVARVHLRLAAWEAGKGTEDNDALEGRTLIAAAEAPAVQAQVAAACRKAAVELTLPGPEAVTARVEELTQELGYIEALRERLLNAVRAVTAKLSRMVQSWRGDSTQLEVLTQVRALSGMALRSIGHRFEQVDANTGEVVAALRNLESQRSFIRSNRDWLYRTFRAWQPLLREWDGAGFGFDERVRGLLDRTYHFLAPRFMPVTEWLAALRSEREAIDVGQRGMVW